MEEFVYKKSDWISRFDCPAEEHMRNGFIAIAKKIVSEEPRYRKDTKTEFVGLELEFPLVTNGLTLVPQKIRDEIVGQFPQCTSVELAAHQLEVKNENPFNLSELGIENFEKDTSRCLQAIEYDLRKKDVQIMRIGCYPLIGISDVDHTKGDPKFEKYHRLPMWHTEHQRDDADKFLQGTESVEVSNAYVVGLMNSVQITIDAFSFTDAIDKLNRSLMISPLATALGANAQYLALRNTGFADMRFISWEISHDFRTTEEVASGRQTRVGLPRRYYQSMTDYFNRVLSYPFILHDPISQEHHFEVGNGIYWRDARLKFFQDKKTVGIEFRPVSIQPTLHEDIAMMMFYAGRLLWSQNHNEPLLPIEFVRANKSAAMKNGLNGQLYFLNNQNEIKLAPTKTVVADSIERSAEGLKLLNDSDKEIDNFLDVLRARITTGSPAEIFAQKVKLFEGVSHNGQFDEQTRKRALIAATKELKIIQPSVV